MRKKSIVLLLTTLFSTPALHSTDPFNYSVPVKNFNPVIYREHNSRYRVTSSDPEFTLIRTSSQRIINEGIVGGKKTVIIEAGLLEKSPSEKDGLSGYLKDTRFLNLSSPEITEAAAKLQNAEQTVSAVERFVYRHISDKTLGIPLMPAARIYRMKRGDCTEHSVLAVALLRKMKIPARAVVGMYLADEFLGKKNVFVYHMWAEAYWNGRWVLADATRPGENRTNRYIAFAFHSLSSEAPLSYLRAIGAIQDLEVEYRVK